MVRQPEALFRSYQVHFPPTRKPVRTSHNPGGLLKTDFGIIVPYRELTFFLFRPFSEP